MSIRLIDCLGGKSVQIEERSELQDDAGAVVWDAALVLAHFLRHCQENVEEGGKSLRGQVVLELGSGTGVVGLVAASLGADKVFLTDLPHLVPCMQHNIEANGLGQRVSAISLEWANVTHISAALRAVATLRLRKSQQHSSSKQMLKGMHPDLILCSDLTYEMESLDNLFFTLALLSGANTTILLSHEVRSRQDRLERVATAHRFHIRRVPPSCLHPDWLSEDINVYILVKQG